MTTIEVDLGFELDDEGYLSEKYLNDYVYIDHQSCATEGSNLEMFRDRDSLKRFLFAKGSFIQCGNDNEG